MTSPKRPVIGPCWSDPTPEQVRKGIATQTCPWCGRGPYRIIALHAALSHDIDKHAFRDRAGLVKADTICSSEVHEGARARALKGEIWKLKRGPASPPQYSTEGRRRKVEMGRILIAAIPPGVRGGPGKPRPSRRAPRLACCICGQPVPFKMSKRYLKTCSPECRHERRAQLRREANAARGRN